MAEKVTIIQKTSAEWASLNPVLTVNEVGVETDTMKMKAGDGTSTWSAVPYGQVYESIHNHPEVETFKKELKELFPGL